MILFFNPYFSNFVKFNVYEWVFYIFLKDRKLARNASCLTHATGAIVLNGMNIMWPSTRIFSLCKHWSTGYFLYDMYFMLMYEKMDKVRLAYMYHHLASCFILQYPPELYYGDRMNATRSCFSCFDRPRGRILASRPGFAKPPRS